MRQTKSFYESVYKFLLLGWAGCGEGQVLLPDPQMLLLNSVFPFFYLLMAHGSWDVARNGAEMEGEAGREMARDSFCGNIYSPHVGREAETVSPKSGLGTRSLLGVTCRVKNDSKAAASLKSPPQQGDSSETMHPWSSLQDLHTVQPMEESPISRTVPTYVYITSRRGLVKPVNFGYFLSLVCLSFVYILGNVSIQRKWLCNNE